MNKESPVPALSKPAPAQYGTEQKHVFERPRVHDDQRQHPWGCDLAAPQLPTEHLIIIIKLPN
jgi:hypothetical protein